MGNEILVCRGYLCLYFTAGGGTYSRTSHKSVIRAEPPRVSRSFLACVCLQLLSIDIQADAKVPKPRATDPSPKGKSDCKSSCLASAGGSCDHYDSFCMVMLRLGICVNDSPGVSRLHFLTEFVPTPSPSQLLHKMCTLAAAELPPPSAFE